MRKNLLLPLSLVLITLAIPKNLFCQTDSIPPLREYKIDGLHSYIDSLVQAGMEEYRIPGAVITVISDSSHVFNKAYGYGDIEADKEVDEVESIFRIASITKTFTAMAVMQLVDDGKLELQTDIREYLPDEDFDFLDDRPISLHHLLTHTAGFDLTDTGDASLTPEGVIPIEEMARRRMPDRVYDPGEVHSYSNFGYTLIGYIIQHVSGMPYEDYIRKNLLEHLNMTHTGLRQPLPEPYQSHLVKSYYWKDGPLAYERDFTNTLPGGGLISSGADMANYMRMHLNGGIFNGKRLVSPESYRLMTSQQYGSKNTKYGVCYSFFENFWTGRRSIEHSGGQLGFVSLMVLIPEEGAGIFIAQNNRKNAGGFRYDLTGAILDTLLGRKEVRVDSLIAPANFEEIVDNYTGVYKQMNYPQSTFEKAIRLFGQFSTEYKIDYVGNGRIQTYGDDYVMTEEHLFQIDDPESTYKIEFEVDENGKAQKLHIGTSSYERIGWLEKKRVQQMFLFISLVILLNQFLSRPVAWLIRRIKKKPQRLVEEVRGLRRWRYWTGSLLIIGALGIISIFAILRDQVADYGVPLVLKIVFIICTMGGILAILSPYFLWKTWRIKALNLKQKLANTLVITAIIIVTVVFYVYNILGFQYYT